MSIDYLQFVEVPEDKKERMKYIYKKLNITKKDEIKIQEELDRIKEARKNREEIKMTFYIVPEGIARPRKGWKGHFYVPNIQQFYDIMDAYLIKHKELEDMKIISEYHMSCKYYRPITSDMTKVDKVLAEKKAITNIKKPDWDNLGKSTDMLHKLVLDDALATDVRVRKYFSFKPRIEIRIIYYKEPICSYHKKIIKKYLKKFIK